MEIRNVGAQNANGHHARKTSIAGTLGGVAASQIVPIASTPIALAAVKGMSNISGKLTADEVQAVNKAADNVVKYATNLGSKGVTINNMATAGVDSKAKKGINFIKELMDPTAATKSGKNAYFNPATNGVYLNREKLSLSSFHELGHAYNFNNSGVWKALQKARTPSMLLATVFTILPALTKDAKAEPGKELTKGQKFKNGLRKASPILAGVSMLPVLAEEGMASIRGCQWAKQLLDKGLAKKVTKTNILGFVSYAAGVGGMMLASFAAKKIKDMAQEKLEQKQAQKLNN